MKLSIHQMAALGWLLWFTPAFINILAQATKPDAGIVIAYGFLTVILMIAVVPLLLRVGPFKRWFCWTDALSFRQLQAWRQRDLRRYYQIALEDGYQVRMLPYCKRLLPILVLLELPGLLLPPTSVGPQLAGFMLFAPLYPMAVLCLMLASCPIVRIFKRRFQRND